MADQWWKDGGPNWWVQGTVPSPKQLLFLACGCDSLKVHEAWSKKVPLTAPPSTHLCSSRGKISGTLGLPSYLNAPPHTLKATAQAISMSTGAPARVRKRRWITPSQPWQ